MRHVLMAATALCFALAGAAAADPGKGNDQGRAKHGDGQMAKHHGDRGHDAMAERRWAPPGLAKKPHGMPPGQAKKLWSRGERLPRQYYSEARYYVPEPSHYHLYPAPDGTRWVRVGDQYYLTRTDTGIISRVVSALLR